MRSSERDISLKIEGGGQRVLLPQSQGHGEEIFPTQDTEPRLYTWREKGYGSHYNPTQVVK